MLAYVRTCVVISHTYSSVSYTFDFIPMGIEQDLDFMPIEMMLHNAEWTGVNSHRGHLRPGMLLFCYYEYVVDQCFPKSDARYQRLWHQRTHDNPLML